jgi:hypothetical protein
VDRHWAHAKAWLFDVISRQAAPISARSISGGPINVP